MIRQLIASEAQKIVNDVSLAMINLNYDDYEDESPELTQEKSIKWNLI